VNKAAPIIFSIIILGVAVFGTIFLPGKLGLYIGMFLIAGIILRFLFPKKKVQ
jgi:hypothetical protein